MYKRDFQEMAEIIGHTLFVAHNAGGEDFRTSVYGSLYEPFCKLAKEVNPNFQELTFAHAVAAAELRCEGIPSAVRYQDKTA